MIIINMHLVKQFLIILISFFLTVVMFYLVAVVPAVFLLQQGNNNPPPPFDMGPQGIYFSNPIYQIPVTTLMFLVPLFGSLIAYILNGNKKNFTVYLPATVGYLLYSYWLILFYSNRGDPLGL